MINYLSIIGINYFWKNDRVLTRLFIVYKKLDRLNFLNRM